MINNTFIVFEGFDWVGKTTLSKLIAKECDLEYHKSPEGVFSSARTFFDNPSISFTERLSFYTAVALQNSIISEKSVNNSASIVLDRYYYSAIAYHYKEYLSLSKNTKKVYEYLYQPDIVFYIEVKFSEIIHRLKTSNREILADDRMFINEKKFEEITQIYKSILPRDTIYIDNNYDIEYAKDKVIEHLTMHNK